MPYSIDPPMGILLLVGWRYWWWYYCVCSVLPLQGDNFLFSMKLLVIDVPAKTMFKLPVTVCWCSPLLSLHVWVFVFLFLFSLTNQTPWCVCKSFFNCIVSWFILTIIIITRFWPDSCLAFAEFKSLINFLCMLTPLLFFYGLWLVSRSMTCCCFVYVFVFNLCWQALFISCGCKCWFSIYVS